MKACKISCAFLLNLFAYQLVMGHAVVNPTSWDFGPVTVGSFAEKTFVLSNPSGPPDLFVYPVNITSLDWNSWYTPNHNESFFLPTGTTKNIVVRFSPQSVGTSTAYLHLDNAAPTSPLSQLYVTLTGTGVVPNGSITINVTSPERHLYVLRGTEVTVQYQASFPNPKDAEVQLYYDTRDYASPTQGDGNPSSMTLLKAWIPQLWDPGFPAYLKPSDSFIWNTEVPDETYWLCGIVRSEGFTLAFDYYDTPITVYSKPPTPILYTETPNVGSGQTYKLEWNYMVCTEWYELQESESYSMTNPQTYLLQGIETLSKELSHVNASTGPKNYHYRVRAVNGTYNRQGDWSNILIVTVNGVSAAPDIASDKQTVEFGAVPLGFFSDKTVIISNAGNADLVVSGTAITGANASEFSIQSGGGAFTLASGATRNIVMRYTPPSNHEYPASASLSISSNDPDENPFLINLSGTGSIVAPFILVDGNKDDFFAQLTGPINGYLQLRYYAWNESGKPTDDADLSAKIWTAWDDTWFYLYEEVKDDTLSGNSTNVWENDCLELLVDPQATDITTNSVLVENLTALGMSTPGVVAEDSLQNIPYYMRQWKRKVIPGGYALELAIQWSAFWEGAKTITPAVGNVFGLAINQQDNDGKARLQAAVQWAAVLSNQAWQTPKYLGTVKFLSDHRLQFLARNNMTGTTNPVPYDGSNYTRTGVDKTPTGIPGTFSLSQNFPNPFNPTTTIAFSIPEKSFVSLKMFGLDGRQVATLVSEELPAGSHLRQWNAVTMPSGIYFYCLQAGKTVETKKLILMK